MDPVAVIFASALEDIKAATTYDEIVAVCRKIDAIDTALFEQYRGDGAVGPVQPISAELTIALARIFQTSKDLSFHLIVLKAILKPGLCFNYFTVEQMLSWYEREIDRFGATVLRDYAWLNNTKHCQAIDVAYPNLNVVSCFENGCLKYSKETRYFALSIENLIAAYDNSQHTTNEQFWLTIVLFNLESGHANVHKLALELYKRMVANYREGDYSDQKLIERVIELPWTSRNKYSLMANLISVNHELLLRSPNFWLPTFLDGMQTGLTLHHLLAPSQTLVKVLRGTDVFRQDLLEMMATVLWHSDEQLAINLIKFWFSALRQKEVEKLYEIMSEDGKFSNVATTSANFYRLLLLRNAFKKTFKVAELDERIEQFACLVDDLPTKIEMFHVLMDNVQTETDQFQRLKKVLTVLKFIRYNITIENSSFVDQHVMRKLPDFFNLLASKKMSDIKVLREVFAVVRDDIYLRGLAINTYESIMFSLKLLSIVLKQYCGSSGVRLSKNTNVEGNLNFLKLLKDNQIWDVNSSIIFNQLLKLMDESENSDISELALRLLVEYFVKKSIVEDMDVEGGENFVVWIEKKVDITLSQGSINASSGANRHFALKFEHLLMKNSFEAELQSMIESLKKGFGELKNEGNPVNSMENGLHLFRLIDCINYGMKRLQPAQVNLQSIQVFSVLLKLIATYFLSFLSFENAPPSFEITDQKLREYLESSTVSNFESHELKAKLTLFIWYTLRATSESTETIASIVRNAMHASDREYLKIIQSCLELNIQILSRCCHKGVIDSASQAIGRITKMVSDEYSKLFDKTSEASINLHSLLVILKREINSGERESTDVRSARGLIVMAHKIINNRPPFLKFFVDSLLVTFHPRRFEDNFLICFVENVKPIQLHLLAALIRDGELVEEMLRFYDFILLATFNAYRSLRDNFVLQNALLQIIGALVPKLANQKRHLMGEDDTGAIHYEPKAVTAYEIYVRVTYSFRVMLNDLQSGNISTTYTIVLLEFLSNFEYRHPGEHWDEIEQMRRAFQRLRFDSCDKIRLLAGQCFAQWHDNNNAMLDIIKKDTELLFSSDGNVVTSTTHCLTIMIQRYTSNVKFVTNFCLEVFKKVLRTKIAAKFETEKFIGANNFYVRYHLLNFLMFLGFSFDHRVVQSLTVENGLISHFGYQLWSDKLKQIRER